MVYDIGSAYHAYRQGGLLVVEGSTAPEYFERVLDQTLAVLSRLVTGCAPVEAEELLRAKNQIKGQHLIAAEDTHTRMSRLATQELYFGKHISTSDIVEQIDAVDTTRLKDITQRGLAENLAGTAMAVVGPEVALHYEDVADKAMQRHLCELS